MEVLLLNRCRSTGQGQAQNQGRASRRSAQCGHQKAPMGSGSFLGVEIIVLNTSAYRQDVAASRHLQKEPHFPAAGTHL
ncbi:hypothetical protein SKAU_G00054880 [Synaphobranchus kaupii]|uniref:Uncharacterized protein n=1 Tax=Synaphobranchus kaupii TaxID=118154 RepID=A0A9Q1G4L4_SYNKA|nr:hypothetical protein SKAU_G00054880 [Synaphobranchus kaupii]